MPIDAVVFDIGRVLIEWDPERFYDSRLGEAERMRLFQEVDLLGMNEGLDREMTLKARSMAWPNVTLPGPTRSANGMTAG